MSGRTAKENAIFEYTKKLLDWRKGNETIAKGTLKHFVPANGVYLYERKYNGKSIVVILSGSDNEKIIDLTRYKEILPGGQAKDIVSGDIINLDNKTLIIKPRGVFILEF
jgi:glycosidase